MTLLASVRRAGTVWWIAATLAGLFLLGHLPFLASTLEDLDSVNFALGLRDFDPSRHRPHPPGYPIYIALGKMANLVVSEPKALAIWGALFGALSAFALLQWFRSLDRMDPGGGDEPTGTETTRQILTGPGLAATLLTMASPLFWFTASRPMSDVPGLAAALGVQALLATALLRQRRGAGAPSRGPLNAEAARASGRLILLGAFAAALAIGMRSQSAWLTLPLLAFVLFDRAGRGAVGALIGSVVWFGVGALLWAVPLVVASGGLSAYKQAVTAQGAEDIAGVDLLITHFVPRRIAAGLLDTFIHPWAWNAIGIAVLILAVVGGLGMTWRARRALVVLGVAVVPYAVFHMLFHETVTTRYALPLVPALAYLAVRGLFMLGRAAGAFGSAALVAASLVVVVPALAQYARGGSPVWQALTEVGAATVREPAAVLAMHHVFARSAEAALPQPGLVLPAPPKHEWLELVKYWTGGGHGPVWFLQDPKRTDLALIDPRARVIRKAYRWPFSSSAFLGGIRPDNVDWIEIRQPGWFAAEGWDLTPETAGEARLDGRVLDRGPIVAWVQRRDGAATVLVGGRHLGHGVDLPVRLMLSIDGQDVDTWDVPSSAPFFLRFIELPAGRLAGVGPWAKLEVTSVRVVGHTPVPAAIEQFDLQPRDVAMLGFDQGWHEQEYNPSTGQSWRWTSARAVARVSVPADLSLEISGESPLRYFDAAPRIVVRVGDETLREGQPREDFTWVQHVSRGSLERARGVITIETDRTFRPADRRQGQDRRALGLRIYRFNITPAS